MIIYLRRLSSLCVAIALGLTVLAPASAGAQNDTTVTIHLSQCPAGYAGSEPFTDCHDNPIAGVTFRWGVDAPMVPIAVVTDSNGVAFIDSEPLFIYEDPPFDLDYYSVYCSTNDGADEVPVGYRSDRVGIYFSDRWLVTGNVICDWYNVPVASDSGNDGAEVAVTLPSTGIAPATNSARDGLLLALATAGALGIAIGLRRRTVR